MIRCTKGASMVFLSISQLDPRRFASVGRRAVHCEHYTGVIQLISQTNFFQIGASSCKANNGPGRTTPPTSVELPTQGRREEGHRSVMLPSYVILTSLQQILVFNLKLIYFLRFSLTTSHLLSVLKPLSHQTAFVQRLENLSMHCGVAS